MPTYNETWKPFWPPPWEHPFQALSKGMKAMLLCIWTSPVSVRRAGPAQRRQELLKTLRLCDFKARSFFSCPSTQKRCLLCCEALMLDRTLLQILDIPITERIKRIREASYLPSPPHRGSHLRPNSFSGKETGDHLLISTCIKSPFLKIPSNF